MKETQSKFSHKKRPQQHNKGKDRSVEYSKDSKYSKVAKKTSAEQPVRQTRSEHTIAKPAIYHSNDSYVIPVKKSSEIIENQNTSNQENFLQRIIKRILGK